MRHIERHRTHRIGWLRAAVLGANDGIVSTASLVVGVAAAWSRARCPWPRASTYR
jgi:VIT1/CCC1 family predicted Fe2+/Mn2+ transporter